MFTDEEIHTIHSTCAPGTTSDRLCHAAFQIMQERDDLKKVRDDLLRQLGKYETITRAVTADVDTTLPWRKRFLGWLVRD